MAIRFLLHGKVKDGRLDDYRGLAARAVASAREEPGTTEYDWFLSEDGHVVNADTYTDEAAFAAHSERVGSSGLIAEYFDLVEIEGFHVFGPVGDELRAALESLNPTYYEAVERLDI